MPTNLSNRATRNGIAKPVTIEIAGGEPLLGTQKTAIGNLDGRATSGNALFGFSPGAHRERTALEWLVRVSDGTQSVTITATSEKGGIDRATVALSW